MERIRDLILIVVIILILFNVVVSCVTHGKAPSPDYDEQQGRLVYAWSIAVERIIFQSMILAQCLITAHRFLAINRYREDKRNRELIILIYIMCFVKSFTLICLPVVSLSLSDSYEISKIPAVTADITLYFLLLVSMILCFLMVARHPQGLKYRTVIEQNGDLFIIAI